MAFCTVLNLISRFWVAVEDFKVGGVLLCFLIFWHLSVFGSL